MGHLCKSKNISNTLKLQTCSDLHPKYLGIECAFIFCLFVSVFFGNINLLLFTVVTQEAEQRLKSVIILSHQDAHGKHLTVDLGQYWANIMLFFILTDWILEKNFPSSFIILINSFPLYSNRCSLLFKLLNSILSCQYGYQTTSFTLGVASGHVPTTGPISLWRGKMYSAKGVSTLTTNRLRNRGAGSRGLLDFSSNPDSLLLEMVIITFFIPLQKNKHALCITATSLCCFLGF